MPRCSLCSASYPSFGGPDMVNKAGHLLFTVRGLLSTLIKIAVTFYWILCGVDEKLDDVFCHTCDYTHINGRCPELETLEYTNERMKADYDLILKRLTILRRLASAYRQEFQRLQEHRLSSGKVYSELLMTIEANWIMELKEKHTAYDNLLRAKNSLKDEARILKELLPKGVSDMHDDEFYDMQDEDSQLNPFQILDDDTSEVEEEISDTDESEGMDFKSRTSALVHQYLVSRSCVWSILMELDIASLSQDFERVACITGIVQGVLKYLDETDGLLDYVALEKMFNKLRLPFAYFIDLEEDEIAILNEIFQYCSSSKTGIISYPQVVSVMCKNSILNVFSLTKWFHNCTDSAVWEVSTDLLCWIYEEQHNYKAETGYERGEILYEDYLWDESYNLGMGSNTLVTNEIFQDFLASGETKIYTETSCIGPYMKITSSSADYLMPPPGDIFTVCKIYNNGSSVSLKQETFEGSDMRENGDSDILGTVTKSPSDASNNVRVRKTVSFDMTARIIS